MSEFLNEVWGELYWNTTDWLPWLAVQAVFPAVFAAIIQWWFQIRWPIVFAVTFACLLPVNISRLPARAISAADIATMNASLPRQFEGIVLESVSFAHRVFTVNASSPEPLEAADLEKGIASQTGLIAEQCKLFGKWLVTRQIKEIQYVWSWPGGAYSRSIGAEDCRELR